MISRILKNIGLGQVTIQNFSFLSLSTFVSSIGSFLVILILANVFDKTEYGIYKYILSIAGILCVFSLSGGFRNVIIQSASKEYDGAVTHLLKQIIPLNLPMLLVALGVSAYYFSQGNTIFSLSIILAVLSIITATAGIITSGYLNGRKLYKDLLLLQIVSSAIICVFTILAVVTTRNISVVFFANLLAIIISIIIGYFVIKKLLRNTSISAQILDYGKHLNFLNIISTVLQYIDSILVFQLLGPQKLAVYALATPLVDRIIGFFKVSYYFVLPKFTEMGPEKAHELLYRRSAVAFLFGSAIVVLYALIAPYFYMAFFPQYIDSVPLSILFAFNIPIVALSALPLAYLDSLIEIKNKYILQAVSTMTRIASLLWFISMWGLYGVIVSEILTRLIGLLITFILIERSRRKKLHITHGEASP